STTVTTSTSNNPKTPNQPINPLNTTTLSAWKNITINNLTATGASGYSVVWGLPLANYLVSNVTLNNVKITGGAGFEIYDATSVQITGSTSVGSYVTCNALAIISQPQSQAVTSGTTVTFSVTAAGTSGLNNTSPTFQWNHNGVPLVDGTTSDKSVISGATTQTLQINKVQSGESGSYTVTVSNALDT